MSTFEDRDYVLQMLLGIMHIEVLSYAEKMQHMLEPHMMALLYESALAFKLISVGEAATNISSDTRIKCKSIPWRSIINTRNRFAHNPSGVARKFIDGVVVDSLPVLKKQLIDMLK